MSRRFLYSAVVGQERLRRAYLANIVNPKIGGLLISGPKGTGKSTIVHSVEQLLPEYDAVEGCIFNCDPADPALFCTLCRERSAHLPVRKKMKVVSLPLSCTEDRLIGSINIEKLLKTGTKDIVPGILGEAHRNILYVDEVNLLPDHLVDDILDAAALHWNRIEREGISVSHPAEFVLVGSMNPEEGDLRPQILDRFPLCVKLTSVYDPAERVEIIKRNLLFEDDPGEFDRIFKEKDMVVGSTISVARKILPGIAVNEVLIESVARTCAELKVDGQRPDIVIIKTARTLAALDGRTSVMQDDAVFAAELALVHRTRDGGLLEPPSREEIHDTFTRGMKQKERFPGRTSGEDKVLEKGESGIVAVGEESKKKDKPRSKKSRRS
ncbi:MAG: ATP-binding protein [candidate division WOR-3 bacterium]|nr:MAG: ATP-binding protein [candidate division WOR-3 bacterium]